MDIVMIGVTLVSLGLAGVMSFVAWRVVQHERQRSNARVAALAADIRSTDVDLPIATGAASSAPGAAPDSSGMFTIMQPKAALPRLTAVIAAGAIIFIGGASLLVALGRGSRAEVHAVPAADAIVNDVRSEAGQTAHQSRALELVALGHERENDRLVVRGVIRNPVGGPAVNQLTAVVMLFNREGGYLASGRADLQPAHLEPGGETTFLVTVPGATDVGRYRVSFRADNQVIPHVDVRS
jgi:hypothetical protein